MDGLNKVLSNPNDKEAMRDLIAKSKKIREILNPHEWGRRELKALGDRLIDKVPGVRTLYNRWTRSQEGPKSCRPGVGVVTPKGA